MRLVPQSDGMTWRVIVDGTACGHFHSKQAAIDVSENRGRKLQKVGGSAHVFVLRRDGSIEAEHSYGTTMSDTFAGGGDPDERG